MLIIGHQAHRSTSLFLAAISLFAVLPCLETGATEPLDFVHDIQPILEENCWHCHGPDEQESGLRLDRRSAMLTGGDYGLPTVVPGHPEKSYLLEVVNHIDPDMAMPPDEDMLPQSQRDLLSRWIAEGAVWPGQMTEATAAELATDLPWSFQSFERPPVPGKPSPSTNPIDAFLATALHEHSLAFSPPADAATLIRRASLVLTSATVYLNVRGPTSGHRNSQGASSGHTGGLIGLTAADGSTHFISDTIDPNVYRALSNRMNGTPADFN
jgi:mono/diheme cytochrome c family protein